MDTEHWEGELLASSLSRVDGRAHWACKGCICAARGVLTSVSHPMSLAGGVCVPAEPRGLRGPGGKVSSEHRVQPEHREEPGYCKLLPPPLPDLWLPLKASDTLQPRSPKAAAQPCREQEKLLLSGIFLALPGS